MSISPLIPATTGTPGLMSTCRSGASPQPRTGGRSSEGTMSELDRELDMTGS
jgi:hypothetical protein